jgi:hypothetical protein
MEEALADILVRKSAPPPVRRDGGLAALALALRGVAWAGLLVLVPLAIVAMATQARDGFAAFALARADDGAIAAELAADWPADASAAWHETLSERGAALYAAGSAAAAAPSLAAARAAVERDPALAFAWARIAWLESELAGGPNAEAVEALRRSLAACPVCDPMLVRWRFAFALAHWEAMPEDVRDAVFAHAGTLRGRREHADFLAEMRIRADAHGVPFDAREARAAAAAGPPRGQ